MPVTLNGRTWALSDFAPWGFRQNWMPFFEDLVAELSGFQGGILRDQAAASAASARTSAAQAAASAGAAGTGAATGLVYGAGLKSLVTASDVVSVFVYDTRRDSDGGAWTEKCRGTSWYNEPLNTATRGATRRFPTVALIVARAASVTIYDAHDLDAGGVPRMWMVFNLQFAYRGWPFVTSIFALNGRLYRTASNGSNGDLYVHVFHDDTSYYFGDAARYTPQPATIASRNTSATGTQASGTGLVSRLCNAVHATILPGAPLDSAGLPIPTVAVATAVGVSVIHPWGAVYDITNAAAHSLIEISGNGFIYGAGAFNSIIRRYPIPYADAASSASGTVVYSYAAQGQGLIYSAAAWELLWRSWEGGWATRNGFGLGLVAEDFVTPANGMQATVSASHNTGWQPGDIRGAWLCDSVAGSVAALNVYTATDGSTSGWTAINGALLSTSSGALRVSNPGSGASFGAAVRPIATVAGQTYLVRLTYSLSVANSLFVSLGTFPGGASDLAARSVAGISGQVWVQFTAAGATSYLTIGISNTASLYCDFDDIFLDIALPDRSYKGNGLKVNGTLTRTALPCGLAAVSGFSAANYLEQPYNPDLDFGTGDFAICWWAKSSLGSGYYLDRDSSTSGARWSLAASANKLNFVINDSTNGAAVTSITDIVGDQWHYWCAVRRGAALEIWCDGVREGVASAAAIGSLSNGAAKLRMGERVSTSAPANGLTGALLRIAAYAPTPTQIRRMYEDERALVIGGQPALLGGTSSNVTALASNPDTGSLLVGTGDGVSVFSGLARTAYHDGASAAGAVASDSITSVSAMGPYLLVGTAANAGLITEARIGRDLMRGGAADTATPAPSVVTTDATPTDISPRLYVGEGETRAVRSLVTARQYGGTATQVAAYELRYLVRRDLGGALALVGSVNVTLIHETSAGMDATVSVDTTAQTVTERVTGLAATRLVWTVERQVLPLTMGESYAA
jgi:hypothetical protein